MATEDHFQLFTSIRYDPLLLTSDENSRQYLNFITPSPFYMLAYHRDRMVEAAQHFDFHQVEKRLQDGKALHEDLLKEVNTWSKKGGQDEALKVERHNKALRTNRRLTNGSFESYSTDPPT